MIKSYLSDGMQLVHFRISDSAPEVLRHGVPLGIICSHGLKSHYYADDCRIYFYYNASENENIKLSILK